MIMHLCQFFCYSVCGNPGGRHAPRGQCDVNCGIKTQPAQYKQSIFKRFRFSIGMLEVSARSYASAQHTDLLPFDQGEIDLGAEAGGGRGVDEAVAVDGDVLGETVFLHRVG